METLAEAVAISQTVNTLVLFFHFGYLITDLVKTSSRMVRDISLSNENKRFSIMAIDRIIIRRRTSSMQTALYQSKEENHSKYLLLLVVLITMCVR